MQMSSVRNPITDLRELGIENTANIFYQLSPDALVTQTLARKQGELSDSGALVVHTGEFTGRSPKDKFIVKDDKTLHTVNWNDFNIAIEPASFDKLYNKVTKYFAGKEVWMRDCYACADANYRINIRVINEMPWANLFAYNMFLRPSEEELEYLDIDWTIIQAPGCMADPATDGTRQHNFAAVSFSKKIILIGGTAYTGEMKKGIFTILNYVLPHEKGVLSMHCSANQGKDGDTAVFFGLSGTGKTTLSADPERKLIGDDEHGWTAENVFNFEGGCYAKCIDLSEEKEPQIFRAVREGALLENVAFYAGTNQVNYADKSITENTRVSYPLHYIDNAMEPSVGGIPQNIFFLTCDAYGVLPPISKLTPGQAMYQFISGYTAKVAGTEAGVTEPKSTFSACFGAPFLPLHPAKYAQMLGDKMRKHEVNVWLVNTGWTGGPYGVGNRMKLSYTRAMIGAALRGELDEVTYHEQPVFGFAIPGNCPGVPGEILDPRNTWEDKEAYDKQAANLAGQFVRNFEKYAAEAGEEILSASPKI
ncbi:phosphoenolpyruvate carboxykinase (ATP) [Chitinophaga pendula]|uniref:phosphoenolpyruvate carboxykinase (ATP) n=1 Tax=Chitinophaga TaxID=79328 RepID=UPI000BAF8383|nr:MULTISPECIES: phosphoenolpyruvate carboxykinase (ATP) [Chitinophaga]ASZ14679.1 phosphoenolpyruvate carboxykinase (ATP) [Chitinophaga sp. MD30]UCJ07665.1 phosphoenolpyruvate carboxykinase (ATP) [Chitinophaga pendula]